MEASNFTDREVKIRVVRMLKEVNETDNSMQKGIETIKKGSLRNKEYSI